MFSGVITVIPASARCCAKGAGGCLIGKQHIDLLRTADLDTSYPAEF